MRALLKKSLHEVRLLALGTFAWLVMFCWVRVWIVSRLERSRFQAILEQLGDIVNILSPVSLSHLLTFTGRVAIGFDEPLCVLVVVAFAIARGSDVVSGELNRGTLELLLAQPASRLRILYSQAAITIASIGLLAFAAFLGCYLGVLTTSAKVEVAPAISIPYFAEIPIPFAKPRIEYVPMTREVDPATLIPGAINLFCLGFCFAGITSFVSSAGSYQRRTVGIAITFLVLQMVCKLLATAVKDVSFMKFFTVFAAYEPQRLVEIAVNHPAAAWSFSFVDRSGITRVGPLSYDVVLLAIGALAYSAAGFVFHRRDLPAPL